MPGEGCASCPASEGAASRLGREHRLPRESWPCVQRRLLQQIPSPSWCGSADGNKPMAGGAPAGRTVNQCVAKARGAQRVGILCQGWGTMQSKGSRPRCSQREAFVGDNMGWGVCRSMDGNRSVMLGCLTGFPVSVPQAATAFLPSGVLNSKTYLPDITQTPRRSPKTRE